MRVQGLLDPVWSDHFDGLSLRHLPQGQTELAGTAPDQSAFYGILSSARDVGLALVFLQVELVEGQEAIDGG